MELIKDYRLRKLLAEYLHYIFTTGYERVLAHQAVCDYLIKNWDVYKGIESGDRDFQDWRDGLALIMGQFITNDVFDSLKYPTNERGCAIHNVKNTKMLVDRFCDVLEKLKPVLEKDKLFWLGDYENGDPVSCTGKYENLNEYLKRKCLI